MEGCMWAPMAKESTLHKHTNTTYVAGRVQITQSPCLYIIIL